MKKQRERGLHEVFRGDDYQADWDVFGRVADSITRRGFLTGLGTMSSLLGGYIVFHRFMPAGLIPAAFADTTDDFQIVGKDGLTLLNDRPLNAETPPHLLNDKVTPSNRLFVRNNGIPPENVAVADWKLTIDGESAEASKTYTIKELKNNFENVALQLALECGGNGRADFYPPAKGNQWTLGAVGAPIWNGVRLRDLLKASGIKQDAVYIAYFGADTHLSGQPDKRPISRGVPIDKAIEQEAMVAWGMNGKPLHPMNGHPLRLVFGGWPGSTSGKWLERIAIRNQVHDGTKMTGKAYRMPCSPVAPGTKVDDKDMCIIHSMPVKSLITYPESGLAHNLNTVFRVNGHSWAGDNEVAKMFVSIDFGQTWLQAKLAKPKNRLAWQQWSAELKFPQKGYYEVWARAVDSNGVSQPVVLPGWNPKGYLNNSTHRIAVTVA